MDLIKTLFLKATFNLGIYSIFHYINRHKITILYAHSIIDIERTKSSCWQPLRTQHNTKELYFTLKTLSKQYQFISLTTAIKILKKEIKPIDNALVITLDDGYLNNIEAAAVIFSRFNIHPTIFVSTDHTENNVPFWFDRLDYALQQIKENIFTTELRQEQFIFDCSSRDSLKKSYALFRNKIKSDFDCDKRMRNYLKQLSTEIELHTGKALSQIIEQDNYVKLASWQQLKYAQQQLNFEIGSHTVNHARLALVDKKTLDNELFESKYRIEDKLNVACDTFCYPDNSYKSATEKLVKEYYQCALTTDTQLNKVGSNMMRLKRFNLPTDQNPLKILFKVSALRQFYKITSGDD